MEKPKKVILICDTKNEIDDQMAIIYALNSPEIELLGIVSTQNNLRDGEDSVAIYHAEAQKILGLSKVRIEAYRGATHPYGLGPERSDGSDFIIRTVKENLGNKASKVNILCTGPATDIVNVCSLYPDIKKTASFIWVGGFKNVFWSLFFGGKEVNKNADEFAAQKIKELKINLIIIPIFPIAGTLLANTKKMQNWLNKIDSPVTDCLSELIDWNRQRFFQGKIFTRLFSNWWFLCDLAAIAAVKNVRLTSKINGRAILKDFKYCISDKV
jgi:purine nucleosidase